MDLSKAFDCLNHKLLIAKLSAYGFSPSALRLIHSYLSERKQSFSAWRETMIGVPQASVLGPLLFNIYINHLFLFVKDAQICNYADDTTIYACDTNIESVIKTLESNALKIAEWFPNNCMKLNGYKCYLMVFGDKSNDVTLNIGSITIKESTEEKLLGVILDKNLCFKLRWPTGDMQHALSLAHTKSDCCTQNKKSPTNLLSMHKFKVAAHKFDLLHTKLVLQHTNSDLLHTKFCCSTQIEACCIQSC